MQRAITTQRVFLEGRIVESYEKKGNNFVRIILASDPLEIQVDFKTDASLGDTLHLQARILTKDIKIKPTI